MRINLKIPDYLNEKLKKIAEKECISRQAVIIWFLKVGVKKYEAQVEKETIYDPVRDGNLL